MRVELAWEGNLVLVAESPGEAAALRIWSAGDREVTIEVDKDGPKQAPTIAPNVAKPILAPGDRYVTYRGREVPFSSLSEAQREYLGDGKVIMDRGATQEALDYHEANTRTVILPEGFGDETVKPKGGEDEQAD